MRIFGIGRQPGDSLTDEKRKELFYRDREREERQKIKREAKRFKEQERREKRLAEIQMNKEKAEWLRAKNALAREKREHRESTWLYKAAVRIANGKPAKRRVSRRRRN